MEENKDAFAVFIHSLDQLKLELINIIPIPLDPVPDPIVTIIPRIKKNIQISIHGLQDLIDLCHYETEMNVDYNIDFNHLRQMKSELQELSNMIGMNKIKDSIVDQILYFMQNLHISDISKEQDYKHILLLGPPGTGKTELAILLGKIFTKMGILKGNIFKKVTRNDLVGGYLGQTAIKTKEVIQQVMNGVLFIDEAYSLACSDKTDSFAKECIDTLCEAMSDSKNNLMVIAAGYETEMKYLLKSNSGLESRFLWRYVLPVYNYNELYEIFTKKVNQQGWTIDPTGDNFINWFQQNYIHFKAYGRDMEKLWTFVKIKHAKRIYGQLDGFKCISLQDLKSGFLLFKEQQEKDNESYSYLHSLYV